MRPADPLRPFEDRTFKGYDLYAAEVSRQRADEKIRLAKYKDREAVVAMVFLLGLLMTLVAAAAWVYGLTATCGP